MNSAAHQPVLVDHVFTALADPNRRQLLEALHRHGPASASSLATDQTAGLAISRQAIVKHLGILCEAGLVSRQRNGKAVLFQVEATQLAATGRWLQRTATRWQQ